MPDGRRRARAHRDRRSARRAISRTAASRRCRGSPRVFSMPSRRGSRRRPDFAEGYRVQRLIDAARRSHQQGRWIDIAAGKRAGHRMSGANSGHRRLRLHRLGAGQGAGQGRPRRCACSTTIRAARRAGSPTSRRTSNSSPATSAMPPRSHAAVRGVDEVHHLAFVNGTEFFYSAARAGARRRRARAWSM